MDPLSVLLTVLSAVASLALAGYQYYRGNRGGGPIRHVLALLRFITVFSGLLLLVNPKIMDRERYLEKANLILLVDHSTSIGQQMTPQELAALVDAFKADPRLAGRVNIRPFGFGADLFQSDSIELDRGHTDIGGALSKANGLFPSGAKAIVLLTDGNQTLGRDYEFLSLDGRPKVHPVVLGDTTQYEDVSIGLFNANNYAFLGNSFPIEASIRYQGQGEVTPMVDLRVDGKRVHRQRLRLNARDKVATINLQVEAQRVGAMTIALEVEALENERNTANNRKLIALEVIDERAEVVLVSDLLHPDIGALKKSIEANGQRRVTLVGPSEAPGALEDADILILYQPDRNFSKVHGFIKRTGINHFTLTGSKTDWNYLNGAQEGFSMQRTTAREEILPVLNKAFGKFNPGSFQVDGFPPLEGHLGDIQLKKQHEILMYQRIRAVDLERPLFAVLTDGPQKQAVLFGENIWRWRAQTYRDGGSFKAFDDFMGQLMLYLGADQVRSRLEVDHPPIFEHANFARIRASYFDENYRFDPGAALSISVEGTDHGFKREAPLILKNNYYQVELSDLAAGTYRYDLWVEGENLRRSGEFKILDFDPEKQFGSANHQKLERLAKAGNTRMTFPDGIGELIGELASAPELVPLEKSRENIVSLIDFRWLLGLVILALAAEWSIRKYNGLI